MAQTVDPRAFYGYLFAQKRPTKLLDALLRGIANYIVRPPTLDDVLARGSVIEMVVPPSSHTAVRVYWK